MNTWIRQRSAPFSASAAHARCLPAPRARATRSEAFTLLAISRTASNSPSDEIEPGLEDVDVQARQLFAISTFSSFVNAIPGLLPVGAVVSKNRTTSGSAVALTMAGPSLRCAATASSSVALVPPLQAGTTRLAPLGEEVVEPAVGLRDPVLRERGRPGLRRGPGASSRGSARRRRAARSCSRPTRRCRTPNTASTTGRPRRSRSTISFISWRHSKYAISGW